MEGYIQTKTSSIGKSSLNIHATLVAPYNFSKGDTNYMVCSIGSRDSAYHTE
jgi:hypothetical protein